MYMYSFCLCVNVCSLIVKTRLIQVINQKSFNKNNFKSVGMSLAKVKEQDRMTLAKVKEQDGMTLAKVKG